MIVVFVAFNKEFVALMAFVRVELRALRDEVKDALSAVIVLLRLPIFVSMFVMLVHWSGNPVSLVMLRVTVDESPELGIIQIIITSKLEALTQVLPDGDPLNPALYCQPYPLCML